MMKGFDMSGKVYTVNEVYASLQGEGIRVGTFNIFVRFAGCNLQCTIEESLLSPGGFDCDTEFASGRKMSRAELVKVCMEEMKFVQVKDPLALDVGVIFTGGEPALQLDNGLLDAFHHEGFGPLCIETNGSKDVSHLSLDWVTVSPKVAEHAIKQRTAEEVKYVRGYGQAIPQTVVAADYYLISPAFDGIDLGNRNLEWCHKLVRENPRWRLSVQLHKFWKIR